MYLSYFIGFISNIFVFSISKFALINHRSSVSKKARINRFVKIVNSDIGKYSYVGSGSEIIEAKIGKFCSIARDCNIGLATHTLQNISTSPIFTEKKNGTGHSWSSITIKDKTLKVNIGNDVWIGAKAIVLGGVKIGDGAVIAAGAIVTKDVPPFAISAGVPAKIIKYRFNSETINSLIKLNWWNLPEEKLKLNIHFFQKNNFTIEDLMKLK